MCFMEIENTLKNSELYIELVNRKSEFIPKISEVFSYSNNVLPKINNVFANYTGHGVPHSLKVMEYMYELINDISLLSDLELTMLIYGALLHDVGMVVTDEEISKIKAEDISIANCKYSLVLEKYKDEKLTLQECIRPIHGKRSGTHIDKNMKPEWFIIPNTTNISFINEVKNICVSHNENFEWLKGNLTQKEKKGEYVLNSQFVALLLRLADLLDIDETRTPMYLYQLIDPKGHGELEWQQHFVIENRNKIALNTHTGYKAVEFYGKSGNPKIHRKLLKYFDYINEEIENSVKLSEVFNEKKYYLFLKTHVENKIQTRGFNFSDFKLNLDYNAVTSLLMGEHIYGDKKYGLRELIQNSIDACNLMTEISNKKRETFLDHYKPYINIVLDKDKKQVCISDNGTGMSLDILQKYFLNVGVSYYSSDEYKFRGYKHTPIGNYGIGFLACFMLSDNITVKTKRYEELKLFEIELEKDSEYICLTYKEDTRIHGTEIILDYDQFFTIFKFDIGSIKDFIERNFISCNISINIIEVKNGEFKDIRCNLMETTKRNSKYIARIDNYLNDIEGYLEVDCTGINFINKLQGFEDKSHETYIYCNKSKQLLKESDIKSLDIQKFIQKNQIEYLYIPIITKKYEEQFNMAFEILDYDFDRTLNKVIDNIEFITIFCEDIDEFNSKEEINKSDHIIVGDFTFENFCEQFEHCSNVSTYTYLIQKNVISTDIKKLLSYDMYAQIGGAFVWMQKMDNNFIRNVYIPQFHISIPYLIYEVQIKSGLFNILNKHIIPNVSRNNVNKIVNEEYSYAIGKALHLWILDNVKLKYEEKILVQEFIKLCYPETNYFLKIH